MPHDRSTPPSVGVLLGLRAVVLTLPWLVHLLLADTALSALLPLSYFFPSACHRAASTIAASVWRGIQSIFTRANHARIIVSGAHTLPRDESAIVVSNHVAWTDFYMIQELAIRSDMLGYCRWFAKEQLKWVPFLGWGLWAMGMPLVSRKWTSDRRELDRVFRGVLQKQWPIWLISYSEATRYSHIKRLEAEDWCKENRKPMPQHLLYPRTKGFVASVTALRQAPHIKAVYDLTIAYAKDGRLFQQPPSFLQTLTVPRLDRTWTCFVHVERHAIDQLPTNPEALARWLEDRWLEKGQRLEELRQRLEVGEPWLPQS